MAINTHEVVLSTTAFNKFTSNEYFIIEDQEFEVNDYVLFKEIETVGEVTTETGLHRMTQITKVVHDEGLKEGYVLLTLRKL